MNDLVWLLQMAAAWVPLIMKRHWTLTTKPEVCRQALMFGMVAAKRVILRDWKSVSPPCFKKWLNDMVSCIYTHHKFLEVWGPFIEYVQSDRQTGLPTLDFMTLSRFVFSWLRCAFSFTVSLQMRWTSCRSFLFKYQTAATHPWLWMTASVQFCRLDSTPPWLFPYESSSLMGTIPSLYYYYY